jgi:acyl-coenzyme A thioesterase PaaI-like protein
MSLAASQAQLQVLMEQAVFARDYGFGLHAIDDGLCTLLVPFRPTLERPGGVIGGPAFMAAADVAMWMAILTRLGVDDRSVTSALNTTFLSAARREDFLCTARVLKLGRRLIHGTAECATLDGRLLTQHTITYVRPIS